MGLKYISAYLLHHNLHTFPHSQTTTAVTGGTGTQSTPANNVGGADTARRNNKADMTPSELERHSLLRPHQPEAKQSGCQRTGTTESFNDMKPATGIIGKMWNNFTSGSPPK